MIALRLDEDNEIVLIVNQALYVLTPCQKVRTKLRIVAASNSFSGTAAAARLTESATCG